MVKEIMAAVTIPVMAKARIGHFAEAQVLQEIGVDMIDESEGNVLLYVSVFCLASVFFLNNLASESLLVSSYITGWGGGVRCHDPLGTFLDVLEELLNN